MRKILIFLSAIFVASFANCSSVLAEEILDFHSDIIINSDSSLSIKETIIYDFGNLEKHGIYRDIPLGKTSIKVQSISDENGIAYEYTASRQGDDFRIKIGDAEHTISGVHTYNISYQVKNGLRFFNDHDELYQNITGNGWQVPILSSGAKIYLPKVLSKDSLQFACYSGTYGSKETSCDWQYDNQGNVIFESARRFNNGEGLTIVLGWPKGIVKEPRFNFLSFWFQQFWPIFIPIIVFIFLFKKWQKDGKDFPLKGTVIAQYEPPENLRPLDIALILNQKIKPPDIPALIVDLAVRGYIKIKEIEKKGIFGKKDYLIIRTKDFNDIKENLHQYERDFLKDIFIEGRLARSDDKRVKKFFDQNISDIPQAEAVLVSGLKDKFYININLLIKKINLEIGWTKGYFTSDPEKVIKKWLGYGSIILFFAVFGSWLISDHSSISFLITFFSAISSGILFIIFAAIMPKRTQKGADAYWQILGFKEYINTAERYRIQFQEKENIFEQFLPYAMIFGLAEKWGKAFEGIYHISPSWYEGNFGATFNAAVFAGAISNNFNSIGATMISRPGGKSGSGFGGGGFSGSGGGGGGGGSW